MERIALPQLAGGSREDLTSSAARSAVVPEDLRHHHDGVAQIEVPHLSPGQGPKENWGDLNGELVSSKRGSYSREFKEAAVREVIDQSRPIADVA